MTRVQQDYSSLTWTLPVPLPGLVDADGDSLVVLTPCQTAPHDWDADAPLSDRKRAAEACLKRCPVLAECAALLTRLGGMTRDGVMAGVMLNKKRRRSAGGAEDSLAEEHRVHSARHSSNAAPR